MEWLLKLRDALGVIAQVMSVLTMYTMLISVIGFFTTRKYPEAKKFHRYAVLVAARNEEAVIARMVESVRNQAYPSGRLTVFVVADNCTDATALAARRAGAVVYEHQNENERTKGFALHYMVKCIRRDYGIDAFEGYFIFDADNVLKRDYMARMNDAFDAGEKVVVSFRNSKNLNGSWIAASYALHWLRTCRTEHRGRSILGLSARVQGTGVLFAGELIRDGWNYTSFTEDRAFSADAVVKGYHIAYQDAAEFYDEQPEDMRVALRQRLRWAKGHLQSFTESGGKLLRGVFTKRAAICYDMLWTVVPKGLFLFALRVARLALGLFAGMNAGRLLLDYGKSFATSWVGGVLLAAYVLVMEHRRLQRLPIGKATLDCLLFPVFDLIGLLSSVAALFVKVEWKPIPHRIDRSMEEMEDSVEDKSA